MPLSFVVFAVTLPNPPAPIRDTSKPQSATELHLNWPIDEQHDFGIERSIPRSVELQWQEANQEEWRGVSELIPAEDRQYCLGRYGKCQILYSHYLFAVFIQTPPTECASASLAT